MLALGLGADDYIRKPFSPSELVARVGAVLRRVESAAAGAEPAERIVAGRLVVDAARHEVSIGDVPVALTAAEFRLLRLLATHPGRVYTRAQLLDHVVGDDTHVIDRNIDVHVLAIRKKLGAARELIETIRGVGYRLHDPATQPA